MEAAAALRVRSTSQCLAAPAPAHGFRTTVLGRSRRRAPGGRLRALPPELTDILSPKLVPGSPAETGDVSSLIPVSALMLLLYFVSNWVVPELIMKRLQQPTAEDGAAVSMASSTADGGDAPGKTRLKGKKRKKNSRKETMKV